MTSTTSHIRLARRSAAVAALALLTPLTLAACSSDDKNDAANSTSATSTGAAASTQSASGRASETGTMAARITPTDTWAKAADSGMSAAFGTLRNTGKAPVVITGARGDAGPVQLHVTTKTANGMEMKETKSFTVPAGGALTLEPGGSHLMFMNLTHALKAGETQKLTVTFEDGSHTDVTFPVRAYEGAKEKYAGSSHSSHSMDGHSMGEHSMSGHSMDMSSATASGMSMSGMASHSH